jgi:single-strand DNA-binding protein
MRDIAAAQLSGNLTRDVELRGLPSGADVARLRVASTTRRRTGEEWADKTNYFTVEVFGAQARSCAEYLCKGSRVFVDAELDWREWTDQQDHRREAVTLKARKVLFEDRRAETTTAGGDGDDPAVLPAPLPSHTAAPDTATAATGRTDAGIADANELPY